MQLNSTNGNIIIIDKTIKETGRVVYSIYENIIYKEDATILKAFKLSQEVKILKNLDFSIIADNTLSIDDNILKTFYNALIQELGNEWILSDDKQNWLYNTKPIRIVIDVLKNNTELATNVNYKTLVNAMIERHFIYTGIINNIMYVDSLDNTEIAIVSNFINNENNPDGWIFIENKLKTK